MSLRIGQINSRLILSEENMGAKKVIEEIEKARKARIKAREEAVYMIEGSLKSLDGAGGWSSAEYTKAILIGLRYLIVKQ